MTRTCVFQQWIIIRILIFQVRKRGLIRVSSNEERIINVRNKYGIYLTSHLDNKRRYTNNKWHGEFTRR